MAPITSHSLFPAGKLGLIRSLCKRLDVYTEPACIGGVWLVPLFSWYHASWDREPDIPGARPIDTVNTAGSS